MAAERLTLRGIEHKFDNIKREFDDIKYENNQQSKDIKDLASLSGKLQTRLEVIKNEIGHLRDDIDDLKRAIVAIEKEKEKFASHESIRGMYVTREEAERNNSRIYKFLITIMISYFVEVLIVLVMEVMK